VVCDVETLIPKAWAAQAAIGDAAPPLTVRRKGSAPPPELREGSPESAGVDWRASVLLNLVLQTRYLLSIATCG
jgi:Uncharacterized conserved protein (DUF2045)